MTLPHAPISLLQSLISFPSVSSTSNVAINQWIANYLTRLGFDVHFCDYVDPFDVPKSNLLAVREPQAVAGRKATKQMREWPISVIPMWCPQMTGKVLAARFYRH